MEATAKQQPIASRNRNFSLPTNFNSQAMSMLLTRDSAQLSTLSLLGFAFSPSIADLVSSSGKQSTRRLPRYECLLCSRAATVSPRSAFARAILPLLIIAPGENASRPFELRHCHASGQSGHKYCFVNRDHLLNIGY